jgi:hypothetical protein
MTPCQVSRAEVPKLKGDIVKKKKMNQLFLLVLSD